MFESPDAYESSRGINTYVYIYIHTEDRNICAFKTRLHTFI